jgi:hypothetical protein
MFRTITSKFAGTCRRCGGRIDIGERIRWAQGKGSYHLAASCRAADDAPQTGQDASGATFVGGAGQTVTQPAIVVPAASQPAAMGQPEPGAMMSAAIAAQLRQDFAGLLAKPVHLSDVGDNDRLTVAKPATPETPAPAATPQPVSSPKPASVNRPRPVPVRKPEPEPEYIPL